MSIATASIRALDRFNRLKNGSSAFASLPWPTKTTAPLFRSSTTVTNRYPLPMAISSIAIQRSRSELGPGEFPAQVTLLNVLDHVPTHTKMMGYVLNGHVSGKLKDISFELPDEAPVLIGKADFDLPDHAACAALDALDGQFYNNLLEGKAGRTKPPVDGPSPDHIPGTTTRTAQALLGLARP